jgi:uncharacterized protein
LSFSPPTERTPAELREEVYSARMTEQTYQGLLKQGLAALDADNGVVLDATFSRRANREFLREACANANVRLQVVELEAESGKIEDRLRARHENAGEISDARLEDFEKLTAAYEPPLELAPDLIKLSSGNAVSDTAKAVLLRLAGKQSVA